MAWNRWMSGVIVFLVLFPIIQAATTATTLFVWNVPAGTRSYTITYGAACSATEFYFNEIDANFDPDSDGNAAKIPPTANLVSDNNLLWRDYNTTGIGSPSSGPVYASQRIELIEEIADLITVNTEFTSDEYINVAVVDDALYTEIRTDNSDQFGAAQFRFKLAQNHKRVKQLDFHFAGRAYDKVSADPCANDSTGQEATLYVKLWNWIDNTFDTWYTQNDSVGAAQGQDYDIVTFTVDSNLTRYVASDSNVTMLLYSDIISQASGCIILDKVDLNVFYYPDNNVFCQTATVAPITITNNGQANLNIDGNFSSAFSGNDINLVLKAWQGTGGGCGTGGMGGWEKDCSITTATTDLGMTTCRQWNQSNGTTNGRLVTSLGPNDSNQLCFSGDINTFTRRGTYVKTFQVGDFNS